MFGRIHGWVHSHSAEHVSVSEIQMQILELAKKIGFNGTAQRNAVETLESVMT
jgi:hypothetical protein